MAELARHRNRSEVVARIRSPPVVNLEKPLARALLMSLFGF